MENIAEYTNLNSIHTSRTRKFLYSSDEQSVNIQIGAGAAVTHFEELIQ